MNISTLGGAVAFLTVMAITLAAVALGAFALIYWATKTAEEGEE